MSTTPITIAILEDGVLAGQYTAEEIRAANPDCPDVEAAIRCLEAGAYQAELRLGAGGVTTFVVFEPGPFTSSPSDVVEVRARVVKAIHAPRGKAPRRRALASYRGTPAEVRAASDAELVDAVEGRR